MDGLAGVAGSTVLSAFASAGLVGVAARCGPVQSPNARSSHVAPTPVAGGLGVIAAAGLGLWSAAVWLAPELGGRTEACIRLAGVFAVAGLFGLVGFVDDLLDLGAKAKIVLLGALSLAMALVAGAPDALPLIGDAAIPLAAGPAILGAALWVFVVVNAVNFMDGANGLVGGAAAVAGVGLALCGLAVGAPEAALLGAVIAGGFLGFLPWNASARASVFMGDSGALFAGAAIAGGGLMLVGVGPAGVVYAVPLLVLPLLVDALCTLAWRARRGASLLRAHRDHAYQTRLRNGASHLAVARDVWMRSAAACAVAAAVVLGLVVDIGGPFFALNALVAMALAQTYAWFLAKRADPLWAADASGAFAVSDPHLDLDAPPPARDTSPIYFSDMAGR